ncbi:MAG: DUF4380 domain-containing protein [Candidatus Omnitrophica bacterium]|nr:DUF4380 domain-containing protein [Candidatus Omnitrophota bacterium]
MALLAGSHIEVTTEPSGGRIISLRAYGQELLWQGDPFAGQLSGIPDAGIVSHLAEETAWRAFKRNFGFPLSGGDRLWIAPEKEWWEKIPPLDLDVGMYAQQVRAGMVVMTSPVCRETGLQVMRSLRLGDDGEVVLRDEIRNVSNRNVTRGLWNVSRVRRPFTAYFPGSSDQWRSYHLTDKTLPVPSVKVTSSDGKVGVPCVNGECYKFGGMPTEGFSALIKGNIVWERSFDLYPVERYAHGSAVEVFNSHIHEYGEVEIHSPLYRLAPGENAVFQQRWQFRKT